MKKLFVLSAELLSFVAIGLWIGWFLDKKFFLEGWATLFCLLLAYLLWFLNFYRKSL